MDITGCSRVCKARRKMTHKRATSMTAPTGAFPVVGMTARLMTKSAIIVVCSPLSTPQRISSLARNATGIAIAVRSYA